MCVYDPLMAGLLLPERARFYPLGFPLNLVTNSRRVIEAAARSWECFPKAFGGPAMRLRIAVTKASPPLPAEPVFRSWEHQLAIVSDRDNFGCCDMSRGSGFGWFTATVAGQQDFLRYHFLEAMAYTILQYRSITSVHAACVSLHGKGVLLFGKAGAGKSCLSFACARRGWALMSDDAAALVREAEEPTVLGNPYHIRFRPSAATLFPELASVPMSTTRNGEPSIELDTAGLPIATALSARVEKVVFLRRENGTTAHLAPVGAGEARRRIEAELPFLDAKVQRRQRALLGGIVAGGAWELHYSEPGAAVESLTKLVQGVSHATSPA
jgi:hypothetical protein